MEGVLNPYKTYTWDIWCGSSTIKVWQAAASEEVARYEILHKLRMLEKNKERACIRNLFEKESIAEFGVLFLDNCSFEHLCQAYEHKFWDKMNDYVKNNKCSSTFDENRGSGFCCS